MPLLSVAPQRYVVLVVDDRAKSITTRLKCSPLAAEVVACTSSDQAWTALMAGRRYSAVVAHRVTPELEAEAAREGTPVLSIDRGVPPAALASALEAVAKQVSWVDRPATRGPDGWPQSSSASFRDGPGGRLVAVCGPGGTGSSSVAAALAAAWGSKPPASLAKPPPPLARRPEPFARYPAPTARPQPPTAGRPAGDGYRPRVLLADLALHADQAFLHGLDPPPSGLLHLVQAGRHRPVTAVEVGRHTVAAAGGRLLPGLRRPGHWTAIPPSAFDEVLVALVGLFDLVVADITGDFEGEADGGSLDVEERNHMSRGTAGAADAVVVVGGPGANGARRLTQLVNDLLDLGVDPSRIQPLGNRRPCGLPAAPVAMPVPTGWCGRLLPPATAGPLVRALTAMLARSSRPNGGPTLVPVTPGSLGCVAP